MEEEQGGGKRKAPSCSRCSNHAKNSPLTNHKCPYEECNCLLCKLTSARKSVMRKQQQLWRQRNESQRWEDAAAAAAATEGGEAEEGGGKQKQKYCDMCRNHGVLMKNRGHKRSCQYENCPCDFCKFTRVRRKIMQLQQKVKRSNMTTQQFPEDSEWVTSLTAELTSLGIDDTPNITPMPSSSSLPPPPGSFPPPAADSSFPSSGATSLFPPSSRQMEPYPSPSPSFSSSSSSSSRMTRPYLPSASAMEQYPSTSFQMDVSNPHIAGAPSFSSSSSTMHALCPPSSYTSRSGSPISDHESSYPTCPSPLFPSYPCPDNTNRNMTSHSQQTCPVIRNVPPAEPLDCSDRPVHSSRSLVINPNISHYSALQSATPCSSNEPSNVEGASQEEYWSSQRRFSDGVIQPSYKQSHRRNSDSVIQGIYRPSQRRNSDGVIKKFYGQSQKDNSDEAIHKSFVPEERESSDETPPGHYKTNPRDEGEEVIEVGYGAEERLQSIAQMDQRRNSDGVILTYYRLNERRSSDGVIRFGTSQRGTYDRVMQKYIPTPADTSDEASSSSYRQSDRRSSDEISSQSSYGVEQRRNSIEFMPDNYGLRERRDSEEVSQPYYWPYPRSESGETAHDTNWLSQRKDSDDSMHGSLQPSKEHFFENNLKRQHEKLERIDRIMPMDHMHISSEQMSYYKDHPPIGEGYPQATGILRDAAVHREDENITGEHDEMNWSDSEVHEGANLHPETLPEQSYEDMDGPLDLTIRPSTD